jgi:hypothetical protein
MPGCRKCAKPLRTPPARPASPEGGFPGTGRRRPWTRRPPSPEFSMNPETNAPAFTDSSTDLPAHPFPATPPDNLLWRNGTLHCNVEGYFAPGNLTLRRRTLLWRQEPYIAPQNLPIPRRTLCWRQEGYFAARNLTPPWRTLLCAREVDVAPKNLTLRRRSLHCAREPYIATEKLTLSQKRPSRLRYA